eukprot:TRINITY_DN43674_c0_g1_i1.p1 TRINITY_DN43674_c0_g1~~TRINITY_DN43674_c0_g1_i1.p1  ORF type:complete len:306 (-),score=55.75 TRINITY_DN43674_c0_g1_i1:175-1026(-)
MAPQSSFRPREVVLAKYGQTDRYYWATVTRAHRAGNGDELCDIGWLRPQAGSPGGPRYACSDGHDETLHAERLGVQKLRRPSAADLDSAAPPGARACVAAALNEHSDLVGEAFESQSPASHAEAFAAQPSLESRLAALVAKNAAEQEAADRSYKGDPWKALSAPAWPSQPAYSTPMPPISPAWKTAQACALFAPSVPQPFPSHARILASSAPSQAESHTTKTQQQFMLDLGAGNQFAIDLALPTQTCGKTQQVVATAGVKVQAKEERFDFVSDMLSGALAAKA